MATVAVAHHRSHHHRRHHNHSNNRNKISCGNFHTFNPKNPTFAGDLWAGPACSNSPPPSSLPIPKFSLRQKRTVSLDPPVAVDSRVFIQPGAKSAPVSPKSELNPSADFFVATENLRRILNLDVGN